MSTAARSPYTVRHVVEHGYGPSGAEYWRIEHGGRTWAEYGTEGEAREESTRLNVAAGYPPVAAERLPWTISLAIWALSFAADVVVPWRMRTETVYLGTDGWSNLPSLRLWAMAMVAIPAGIGIVRCILDFDCEPERKRALSVIVAALVVGAAASAVVSYMVLGGRPTTIPYGD